MAFSCTEEIYDNNPEREQVVLFTKNYKINARDWQLVGEVNGVDSYYEYLFKERNITQNIYEGGMLVAYLYQMDGKVEIQTPLPFNFYDTNGVSLWTERYSFNYNPGEIAFTVHFNDFVTQMKPPSQEFRLVVMHK
ncbi:hypothetical protein AwDysgo_08430 [Bacteroidales bacterium]|nr:hypothetical protein AwDysgo_08430 [Bacteroidales bacterium]